MVYSPPQRRFGQELRRLRESAGYQLGNFAKELGISKTYLSDVELGRREPFRSAHLLRCAELLGVDYDYLLGLAAESRGAFELKPITRRHSEAGMALMRKWEELGEEELDRLMKAIGADEVDIDEFP